MNDELRKRISEYEELKIEAATLEARMKELAPYIISALPDDAKVESDLGTLIVSRKSSWVYSPVVDDMEQVLKDRKKQEQADGTAEEVKGPAFLTFRKAK